MAALGKTIASLARQRRVWDSLAGAAAEPGPSRLAEVTGFAPNPGNLRMLEFVPKDLGPAPALVVVLHGCTQTASGYDRGAGWSTLAERHGFALLFPEQRRANNPKACFNWFDPRHARRGMGEAASIRAMVARMVALHGIDEARIFVTGLSAGGAMTSVMLATYPEVFAAGAIVAGLPYGAATNVQEAFDAMHRGRRWPARHWGDLVRAASDHRGPWPRVSVWQGGADRTVVPMNADEIVKQWADLHGLPSAPSARTTQGGISREVWRDRAGLDAIERFTLPTLAHGTPLATGEGEERAGVAGPFLLEAGISSTHGIARFFRLIGEDAGKPAVEQAQTRPERTAAAARAPLLASGPRPGPDAALTPAPEDIWMPSDERAAPRARADKAHAPRALEVGAVIEKALRAAGLMR